MPNTTAPPSRPWHYSEHVKYKTVWVEQRITSSPNAVLECAQVDSVVNAAAADGWILHTLVPGTNAQTYSGLFVTFQRAD